MYCEHHDLPETRRRRRRRKDGSCLCVIVALLGVICVLGRMLLERPSGTPVEGGGGSSRAAVSAPASNAGAGEEESGPDSGDKRSYILAHPELYPEALRELVEKNDEILDYVYRYPELKHYAPDIDLTGEVRQDTVPLLLQWDARWGYLSYGDGLIGYTGCGPTCLSMVAIALTGDASITPAAVAAYAESEGHYSPGSGTAWSLMASGCGAFGLRSAELPLNENTVIRALAAGKPVVCSLRAGDFTEGGHFIVLTGYEDGVFILNDPNSRENSAKTWSWARLEGQIKNLWSFELE